MQRRKFMAASLGAGMLAAVAGAGMLAPRPPAGAARRDPGLQGMQLHAASALAFGTVVTARVLHHDRRLAEQALEQALQQARLVDAHMSIYRDTSQVGRLNAVGRLDHPGPELVALLRHAQRLSALTDGAFDVTVQPLWQLYRDRLAQGRLPTGAELDACRAAVGWRLLQVEEERIAFARPGMALTLNGMAQGHAADRALAAVRALGVRHALLDIGEYAGAGEAEGGRPWSIGIADPRRPEALAARIELDGRSIATSGDYETAFSADFSRHHIVDPRTGLSPPELASVTVVAPSALQADALSTAFLVTGRARAIALAAAMPEVDVFFIDKQGTLSAHAPHFRAGANRGLPEFLRRHAG